MILQLEDLLNMLGELTTAGLGLGYQIALIALSLLLMTIFLRIGIKAVGGKHLEFGAVFLTALIGYLVELIPCIGCIIYWFIIKSRHDTSFGGAIGAWLLAFLIPFAIIVVIVIVFFGGLTLISELL
jgi:hypothetical protein